MSWTRSTTALEDAVTRDFVCELRAEGEDGDGFTFSGYAARFNEPTTIDSYEGKFVETIARGAFNKTIKEGTPVLMFDHGRHAHIGTLPIGVVTEAREDDRGLFVRARLHRSQIFEPVIEGIKSGAISGMSFRFSVVRDTWNKTRTERTLNEVKVAELGPVIFPAYAGTSASVRDEGETMTTSKSERMRTVRKLQAGAATRARRVGKTTKAQRLRMVGALGVSGPPMPRNASAEQRRRWAYVTSGIWIPDAAEQERQRAWASEWRYRTATDRTFNGDAAIANRGAERARRDRAMRADLARWNGATKPEPYERIYDRHGRA